MMRYALLFLMAMAGVAASAQTKYEPQILVLCPDVVKSDPKFEKEIADFNKQIKVMADTVKKEDIIKSEDYKEGGENLKKMLLADVDLMKKMDFFKQVAFFSTDYLLYRFIEHFPNLLILPKDIKSACTATELNKIAAAEHFQYILNFPSLEIYSRDGINYAKMRVQLYDGQAHEFVIDRVYTGDWKNPGFEFCCKDSSLNCTINNALSQALTDVVDSVMLNSPKIKGERQLAHDRYDELMGKYYTLPPDKDFVKGIVGSDHKVNMSLMYQCIRNTDNTKFVAFFLDTSDVTDLFKGNGQDKNIKITTNRDIKDSDYLSHVPGMYAYMICGVQYKGKWYYAKENISYFEAADTDEGRRKFFNQLQIFDFFKEGSTAPSPDFWETHLFEKIKDITKDPEWEKYGKEIYATREKEDRPYIGMYKIVVDELKREKDAKD